MGQGSSRTPGVVDGRSWWPSPLRDNGLEKRAGAVNFLAVRPWERAGDVHQRRRAGTRARKASLAGVKGLDFIP